MFLGSLWTSYINAVIRGISLAYLLILLFVTTAVAGEANSQMDASDSNWLAEFQSTYVWQKYPAFQQAYSGPNSFNADSEKGWQAPNFLVT